MGRFGEYVIEADGHGGEPLDWRERVPDRYRSRMGEYMAQMNAVYRDLPGGGVHADLGAGGGKRDEALDDSAPMRPGMYEPAARLDDMDLEGIGGGPLPARFRRGVGTGGSGVFRGALPGSQ